MRLLISTIFLLLCVGCTQSPQKQITTYSPDMVASGVTVDLLDTFHIENKHVQYDRKRQILDTHETKVSISDNIVICAPTSRVDMMNGTIELSGGVHSQLCLEK